MNITIQEILKQLSIVSEIIAAIIAVVYYPTIKNSFWKWFVLYLVFIAIESIILKYFTSKEIKMYLYDYLIVPIEFLFFFWLYAMKSLKMKSLFWVISIIYVVSFLPHLFYIEAYKTINQLSYIVGCLLLFVLVVLEFHKQILTDDILLFKQNKMFYINIGIMFFYIGSLPLFAFFDYLFMNEKVIFHNYYTFFLLNNNIMYLLFGASFIWGKFNK